MVPNCSCEYCDKERHQITKVIKIKDGDKIFDYNDYKADPLNKRKDPEWG